MDTVLPRLRTYCVKDRTILSCLQMGEPEAQEGEVIHLKPHSC